jgi:hypothetical protein
VFVDVGAIRWIALDVLLCALCYSLLRSLPTISHGYEYAVDAYVILDDKQSPVNRAGECGQRARPPGIDIHQYELGFSLKSLSTSIRDI